MSQINRRFIKNLAIDTSKLDASAVTLEKMNAASAAPGRFLRVGMDGVTLEFAVVDASGQIDAAIAEERTARMDADADLWTAIDAESTVRQNADLAEQSARIAAIVAEQSARTAADAAEASIREAAVLAEQSARIEADNTERSARIAADSAETTAREAADLLEASVRLAADLAEQTARIDADNALSQRIDNLSSGTNFLAPVKVATADAQLAAAINGSSLATILPLSDDSAPILTIDDFAVGDKLLYKNGASSKMWFVYEVSGVKRVRDRAEAGALNPFAFANGDAFMVQEDLTDPLLQGPVLCMAKVASGILTDVIKIADFDWNVATGIGVDVIAGISATTVQGVLQALKDLIDAEVTTRADAILAEQTARQDAIAAEASLRSAADLAEVTARNAAIAVETSARQAADLAELTARQDAIAAEATARAAADLLELTARQDADAALNTRIDALEGRVAFEELHIMTAPEIAAKSFNLTHTPVTTAGMLVVPVGGVPQFRTIDFRIVGGVLSWGDIGAGELGMSELMLEPGDKLYLSYMIDIP